MLNPAFTLSRYPDVTGVAPVDAIISPEAREQLAIARRILEWVTEQL